PMQFRVVPSVDGDNRPATQKETNAAICRAVMEDIIRLKTGNARLDGRPVGLSDMAVLVRTHFQAAEIQRALIQHGIRSIVRSERSVFHSLEAFELQQLFQGIIEPAK